MKKKRIRTPGNRVAVHMKRIKVGVRLCANCKKPLRGLPKLVPSKLADMSKTKKGISRPYGGYLCSNCTKEVLKERLFSM